MAIRSSSKGSIRSASNVFATYGAQLEAAQKAKQDADYNAGLIADAAYIAILKSRKSAAKTPVEAQTIDNQIADLQTNVQRKVLKSQIESGDKSYFDLAKFEQNILSSMVPGTARYIDQQNTVNQVRDNAVSAARAINAQQLQNGSIDPATNYAREKDMLSLYEPDGLNSQSYQNQLFKVQDAQRAYVSNDYQKVKALEDAHFRNALVIAQNKGDYSGYAQIANQWQSAMQKRITDHPEVFFSPDGTPTAAFDNLSTQQMNLANAADSFRQATITKIQTANDKGRKNEAKAAIQDLNANKDAIQNELSKLENGLIKGADGSYRAIKDGAEYINAKAALTQQLITEDTNLIPIYQGIADLEPAGSNSQLNALTNEISSLQDKLTNDIMPKAAGGSSTVDMWDGKKWVPYDTHLGNINDLSSFNQPGVQGGNKVSGVLGSIAGEPTQGLISTSSPYQHVKDAQGNDMIVARVGDQIFIQRASGQPFVRATQQDQASLFTGNNAEGLLKSLGFDAAQAAQMQQQGPAIQQAAQIAAHPELAGQTIGQSNEDSTTVPLNSTKSVGISGAAGTVASWAAGAQGATYDLKIKDDGTVGVDYFMIDKDGQKQPIDNQKFAQLTGLDTNVIEQKAATTLASSLKQFGQLQEAKKQQVLAAEQAASAAKTQQQAAQEAVSKAAPAISAPVQGGTTAALTSKPAAAPIVAPAKPVQNLTVQKPVAGPAKPIPVITPATAPKTNPTIPAGTGLTVQNPAPAAPLTVQGNQSTALADPVAEFLKKRSQLGVGGSYDYQFKVNPDQTAGIDFFQNGAPTTREQFASGTGKSFDEVNKELQTTLQSNADLAKKLNIKI